MIGCLSPKATPKEARPLAPASDVVTETVGKGESSGTRLAGLANQSKSIQLRPVQRAYCYARLSVSLLPSLILVGRQQEH